MDKIAILGHHWVPDDYWPIVLGDRYELVVYHSYAEILQALNGDEVLTLVIIDFPVIGSEEEKFFEVMKQHVVPVIRLTDQEEEFNSMSHFVPGEFDYLLVPVDEIVLKRRIILHIELGKERIRYYKMEEQLEKSEKMAALGQMAAGVAHEINNPIGFVSSNANLLQKYVKKMEVDLENLEQACQEESTGAALLLYTTWKAQANIFRYINDIKEISEESLEGLGRVREIVKDLKEYAHIGEAKYENADINRMLTSTLNLLRNEIKYKADIDTSFGDLPAVQCIVSQLNQVFVNIIVNACHAIDDFGLIQVSTMPDGGDHVLIRIRDSGKGIPRALIKKIFEPFFTTKAVGKGTGIGLAISRSIIERHHGEIRVESDEGHGTQFEIRLPVEQMPDDQTA